MKRASLYPLFVLSVAFLVAGTGCQKTPKDITPIPGAGTGPGALGPEGPLGGDQGSDTAGQLGGEEGPSEMEIAEAGEGGTYDLSGDRGSFDDLVQNTNALSAETVYFDFDRSNVKASEEPKLDRVASYLEQNSMTKLLIEGHCDKRGTEEYNRSLGERRALSLREYLINLGINPDRITTISYGEDRPAVPNATTEGEFARNRRGEFVVLEPQSASGSSSS